MKNIHKTEFKWDASQACTFKRNAYKIGNGNGAQYRKIKYRDDKTANELLVEWISGEMHSILSMNTNYE